jgi:hypothetical protein
MTLSAVPTGVPVEAILTGSGVDSVSGTDLYLSSLAQADVAASFTAAITLRCPLNSTNNFFATVVTNASGQIRRRSSSTTQTLNILTTGWRDARGRV